MVKVKMTSNRPIIFRASDDPGPPKFPFDGKVGNDWTDDETCPSCNTPFSEHSDRQIIRCALAELRGEKP